MEAFLKILALTPNKYFSKKWNLFDIVVVILSLLDLILDPNGFSALRSFRLVD